MDRNELERLERETNRPYSTDYEAHDTYRRELHRRGELALGKCALAQVRAGAWKLEPNDVWSVPDDVAEVPFQMERWPGYHAPLKSVRGIAMDEQGCVYGPRVLSGAREMGHCLEGRVSIGGQKYRAFTSSRLFERPDGSLVDVGILYVCRPKDQAQAD